MFSLAIYWGNCLLSILIAKLGLMINKEKTTILAIVSALPTLKKLCIINTV